MRLQRARLGDGPTLLECKTYRTRPHAEGMGDFTYRTREEVEAWKTRDPILRLKDVLLQDGLTSEPELRAIDDEVKAVVGDAREFAEKRSLA